MIAEDELNEETLNEGEDQDGEESEGGLDKKKILVFVAVPLVLLCLLGAGLYFTGTLDKLFGDDEVAMEGHEVEGDVKHKPKKSSGDGHGGGGGSGAGAFFVEIPNMIVNLSGTGNQPRYLRLSVQIELDSEDDKLAVEAVMPRVVDQFQTYLRELRVKDLKGSTGLYRLRIELLSRLNAAAYPVKVKDVLFQEILIQ